VSTVGVVGLGRLGMPFAFTLAAAGHEVLAWDTDKDRRALADHGVMETEAGLPELMRNHRVKIADLDELSGTCTVVFVVVATPSRDDGSYDPRQVEAVTTRLGDAEPYDVVAVVSTVSPGTCRRLSQSAPRRLVYAPQLVSLHSVVADLQMAPVWILGSFADSPAQAVGAVLGPVSRRGVPARMSWESAELAKMAVNVQMAAGICYANQLQRMAWLHPAADVDQIGAAVYLADRRAPLIAGAGFGGPCLPRDGAAFLAAGGAFGHYIDHENEVHLEWVVALATARADRTFAVLGLPYKEGGTYQDDSFGVRVMNRLVEAGLRMVPPAEAEVVVLALALVGEQLPALGSGTRVIDLWRRHSYLADRPELDYVAPGAAR
jgi:UDPglucose 6-dehydrogenase